MIAKVLWVSQQNVLLGMDGAYRTVIFAALTVIVRQQPLDFAIEELKARCEIKKKTRQVTETSQQSLDVWQEKWDLAVIWRYA